MKNIFKDKKNFREFWKCWRIYPPLMIIFSKKMLTRPVFWVSFPFFKYNRFLTWLENIFTKLFHHLLNISQNGLRNRFFVVLHDANHRDTWKNHFSLYFCNINLYWKSPISATPGRTQTRILWARNWILTFRKKRWLRIEKLFHMMNSTCIFTPVPLSP